MPTPGQWNDGGGGNNDEFHTPQAKQDYYAANNVQIDHFPLSPDATPTSNQRPPPQNNLSHGYPNRQQDFSMCGPPGAFPLPTQPPFNSYLITFFLTTVNTHTTQKNVCYCCTLQYGRRRWCTNCEWQSVSQQHLA